MKDFRLYLALVLAAVAAVLSTEHPGEPYQQARFLFLGTAAATVSADATPHGADLVIPP